MMPTTAANVLTPCVLLVDDDPQALAALGRVFRDEPYQVLRTNDPWQALEWLKSKTVHLLVTDEFMPGLLGTDLLEAVRFLSPATATILLTGYPKPAVAYRGFQQRMDLLMPKPWEDEPLRDAALRLLRQRAPRTVFKRATPSADAKPPCEESRAN
ncbi:MAG TPA: response regulator [Planctomycetota bacterium]|jgi:DNA-binding NtrC family response regulator|nr:response regulator [Planctomycetota bacterium]